ncbi:hypothetical protein ACFVVA_15600 [Kitasatospora sp. NPDC058048]
MTGRRKSAGGDAHLAELAVPEWRAALEALQQLPEIGTDGPDAASA